MYRSLPYILSGLCDLTQCILRCNMPLNPSNHMPVLISINVGILHRDVHYDVSEVRNKPIAWYKEAKYH